MRPPGGGEADGVAQQLAQDGLPQDRTAVAEAQAHASAAHQEQAAFLQPLVEEVQELPGQLPGRQRDAVGVGLGRRAAGALAHLLQALDQALDPFHVLDPAPLRRQGRQGLQGRQGVGQVVEEGAGQAAVGQQGLVQAVLVGLQLLQQAPVQGQGGQADAQQGQAGEGQHQQQGAVPLQGRQRPPGQGQQAGAAEPGGRPEPDRPQHGGVEDHQRQEEQGGRRGLGGKEDVGRHGEQAGPHKGVQAPAPARRLLVAAP